jgi:hypothetical protein
VHRRIVTMVSAGLLGSSLLSAPMGVHASYADVWVAQSGFASAPGTSCDAPGFVGTTNAAIQSAVDAADSGTTIHICEGTYEIASVIDLASKNITLKGASPDLTILDGGGTYTEGVSNEDGVQIVFSDGRATIDSMTLQRGYSNDQWGGAIHVEYLTLRNSIVKENFATVPGGAVHGLDVTIFDSSFFDNDSLAPGGAINAYGNLEISDSELIGNHSEAAGGAVYVRGSARIVQTYFSSNSAAGPGGAFASLERNDGLRQTRFFDGVAFLENDSEGFGGAIAIDSGDGDGESTRIISSRFEGNTSGRYGGAINAWTYHAPFDIVDSRFVENISTSGGGALNVWAQLSVIRSHMVGNQTLDEGGAINTGLYRDTRVEIRSSVVESNVALSTGGGLGLYLIEGRMSGRIFITSNLFRTNTSSVLGAGVSVYSCGNPASSVRGRVLVSNRFDRNRASGRPSKVDIIQGNCD